jgi:hypothetical protein
MLIGHFLFPCQDTQNQVPIIVPNVPAIFYLGETWFAGMTVDNYTFDRLRNWDSISIRITPAIIAKIVLALFIFVFQEKNYNKTS